MKCSPWRWLLGVVPVAIMSWLAVLSHHPSIEADLANRTATALARSGNDWAKVQFTGREGALTGKTTDDSAAAKAIAAAKATWGVREVEDRSALVDKVDKYSWSAERAGDRIRLEGHVPSEAVRGEIAGLVRSALPNASLEDKLQLTRGAPTQDVWMGGIAFALRQLALLKEGQVDLEQTDLSVRGTASDPRAYETISSALSSGLPKGIALKRNAVRAAEIKPYVWAARLSAPGAAAVTGYVPDAATRDAMRTAFAGGKLDDRSAFATGEPKDFTSAIRVVLAELANLEEGAVEIRDTALSFVGVAADKARADAVRAGLQKVSAAFKVSEQIAHRVPTISPYVTAARVNGTALVLSGHAPTEAAKSALAAAAKARLPDRDIRNGLEIGLGEAATWQTCSELGLDALRQLGNGASVLTGRRLEVSGEAASERAMQELTEALRDSAGRDCDTATRITFPAPPPPPSLPAADADAARKRAAEAAAAAEEERRRSEAAIQHKRMAAEEEKRRQAEEAANRRAEEAQKQAAAARQKAEDAAREKAAASAEKQRRAEEDASAKRNAAATSREEQMRQREQEALRQRAAAAAAADADLVRRQEIAAACQDKLRTTVREGVILFDYAKFHITPGSHATLDRVAEAINACPDFKVEIGGHTDTDGAPDRNERLSERRAKAVLEYLVESGVSASRLKAVGFGETRAIAPNDTPENKAKNRRIEFSVTSE
jgi:OmpA-OmpF porin, OOP family